jgi:hypothetical protein
VQWATGQLVASAVSSPHAYHMVRALTTLCVDGDAGAAALRGSHHHHQQQHPLLKLVLARPSALPLVVGDVARALRETDAPLRVWAACLPVVRMALNARDGAYNAVPCAVPTAMFICSSSSSSRSCAPRVPLVPLVAVIAVFTTLVQTPRAPL